MGEIRNYAPLKRGFTQKIQIAGSEINVTKLNGSSVDG
jgi:hypothetical protein